MQIDTPRGMDDLLPREFALKRKIEEAIREVFRLYGYLEVETPTIEHYELFAMKSGEEIRQRMFEFEDKAGRRLVLRPEVTASIARLISTKLKAHPHPIRLGYIADCYRYDEPQWGRKRRFWQGGFELFGSKSPLADAEILQVSHDVFKRIGLNNHFFKVGHVGILRKLLGESGVGERDQDRILTMLDRKLVNEAINLMKELSVEEDVIEVIQELVALEGYDHENIFKKASDILSRWNGAEKCLENLREIIYAAEEGGVRSQIIVSPGLARGLEYYDGFIFEQGIPGIHISFNGGGRYDGLVELLGGKPTPAVGCAIGITRIMQYILDKSIDIPEPPRPKVLLAGISGASSKYVAKVAGILRGLGIPVEVEVAGRKLSTAIEFAAKNGMEYIVIVGEKEEKEKKLVVKNLESRIQVEVDLDDVERLREVLRET